MNMWELEANTNDLHAKFESVSAQLEEGQDGRDVELESSQEDENDRLKETREGAKYCFRKGGVDGVVAS